MRTKRRYWLWLVALPVALLAWQQKPAQEFVHLSDLHVTDLRQVAMTIRASRMGNEGSSARLAALLQRWREGPRPEFAVVTGDLIDSYSYDNDAGEAVYGQMDALRPLYESSPTPLFLLLGNHDVQRYRVLPGKTAPVGDQSVSGDARAAWRKQFGCFRDGTYYAFTRKAGRRVYRFLMLDNGESAARNPEFVGQQAEWLQRQLREHDGDSVIVAMHVPLQDEGCSTWIRSALARAGNVALVLAGHRHTDGLEEVVLAEHRVLQVRTAGFTVNSANQRRIRLLEDQIEIYQTGRPEELLRTVPAGSLVAVQ